MKTFNLDAILDDIILLKNSNEPTSSEPILSFITNTLLELSFSEVIYEGNYIFKSFNYDLEITFNFESDYKNRNRFVFENFNQYDYLHDFILRESKFDITILLKDNPDESGRDYITIKEISDYIYTHITELPVINYEKVWESQYKLIENLRTVGADQEFLSILLSTYSEYIYSIKNNNQDLIVRHKEFLEFHADLYQLYYPV